MSSAIATVVAVILLAAATAWTARGGRYHWRHARHVIAQSAAELGGASPSPEAPPVGSMILAEERRVSPAGWLRGLDGVMSGVTATGPPRCSEAWKDSCSDAGCPVHGEPDDVPWSVTTSPQFGELSPEVRALLDVELPGPPPDAFGAVQEWDDASLPILYGHDQHREPAPGCPYCPRVVEHPAPDLETSDLPRAGGAPAAGANADERQMRRTAGEPGLPPDATGTGRAPTGPAAMLTAAALGTVERLEPGGDWLDRLRADIRGWSDEPWASALPWEVRA